MPTANITPVFYRVTWNGASPTNYNALTGNQAGGVDNTQPERYLRLVKAIGSQANPTVANLDTIRINGVTIQFTTAGGVNLAGIISTINAAQTETKVWALESPSTYLTLVNLSGWEGYPIEVSAVTPGVVGTKLGLQETTYQDAVVLQGGSQTLPLTNLDNVRINGVTITFTTAGGLNLAGVISTINAQSDLTRVRAQAGGGGMVLLSTADQPFTLTAGSTSGTWGNLGFTVGNKGGSIVAGVDNQTLAQSVDKERATMRWDAMVFELGWLISPIFLGEITKTGNFNGTAPITTLSFTVGYDRPEFLRTPDELTAGQELTGVSCVRRLLARALLQSYVGNQEVFDPTLSTAGNTCVRLNPLQIQQVSAAALDSSLATLEANITVTQIVNI